MWIRCVEMMWQQQRLILILIAKVVALGSTSIALLGLGLVWTASALASEPNGSSARYDVDDSATTVEDWLVQLEAALVQITDVSVETTDAGLQVVLETVQGELSAPMTATVGSALIAEIPNAVLDLPDGEPFEQFDPANGIALVSVTNLPDGGVRVSITGTDGPPEAQMSTEAGNVVFSAVPGIAQVDDADDDIQIVVTGEQEDGYRVERTTTATRTDTAIRDIPASIQVIPQEVIQDQGATTIREVLRNVSGVTFADSSGGRAENFTIRGFTAIGNVVENGFREDFFITRTERELAHIERIEVLKGPSSVLFGQTDPSGIINFVTEQPLLEPYYEVSATLGTFDFYRPTIDLSGPLTADRRLAYRLNLAYEDAGSFRDFVDTERFFVAPTLAYQFSDNTRLSVEVSHLDDARPIDRGLPVLSNNEIADIPISRFLGGSEDTQFAETRALLSLNHRFSPNLSLRSAFRYTDSQEEGSQIQISSSSPNDRIFPLNEFFSDQNFETYTLQNELTAEFDTGPVEHIVLLGLELSRRTRSTDFFNRSAGTIDIFNPTDEFTFGEFPGFSSADDRLSTLGVYLQDQISLLDNLILVLGGRFDISRQDRVRNAIPSTDTDADAFSPRVGLVYQPTPNISLYGNFSRSFTPVGGLSVNNDPFDPQRGTGYEVGIKTDFLDNRFSSTLAFYNTNLSNILTSDPDNPGFSIQVGEQRSRGIELDVAGEILPGWNLIATYAHTDAEISEDNRFDEGNRLADVPLNSASLWTTYDIQRGLLEGLGFGAGVFFVGDRQGDLANSFEVPSYVRTDAAVYYERNNFRAGLNFLNVFDIRYFEGAQNRNIVNPGASFTALGTISWRF